MTSYDGIEIEDGVHLPPQVRSDKGGRPAEYPYMDMKPGQSIRIKPEQVADEKALHKFRTRIHVRNHHYRERGMSWKVGRDAEGIWRLWRIS